jgi:hypothetical protein
MAVGKPRKKETYMSNLKKVLATTAGAALGFSSLVGLPATAASANNVTLELTDGANTSLFNSDTFNMDLTAPTLMVEAIYEANFMLVINNPDSVNLLVDWEGVGADYDVTVLYVDADGDATAESGEVVDADENTAIELDFATSSSVTAILTRFQDVNDADIAPTKIELARIAADDDYGDDGASVSVLATVDTDADFTTVETGNASDSLALNFVDPATVSVVTKLQRIVSNAGTYLNTHADEEIVGTVHFSNPDINMDQTDWGAWLFDVDTDGNESDANTTPDTSEFVDGFTSHDAAGKALVLFPVAADLAGESTYKVRTQYETGANTREFSSNGFQVVVSTSLADAVVVAVTEDENAYETAGDATESRARTGSASVEFTATADEADANIPVVITVTATAGTVSIAGAGAAAEGETLVWNTLTNADGEVVFSVTSSAEAGDDYTINAYIIEDDGTSATNEEDLNYEDAAVDAWETNSTVLAGSSLVLSATIVDQFGEAISDDDGEAISVGFTATDADDLEEFVAVVGGSASITFANWLADGDTDNITVNAFTGDSDDQTAVNGLNDISVTLYSDLEVSGITTNAAEYEATVGYSDFGDDVTAADGTAATVAGTVIDSVGAGVPGASVTISGAGLQFNEGDDWAVGSHTFAADEAGAFSVDVYTHLADDSTVTITSGGKSTTVTIAGALNDGAGAVSAADLLLSWNLAEVVMYNTTYRVDASVTDVWGNPIPNAEVTFAGEAAAQFNSDASVTKTTGAKGTATAYLRSLADVSGLAAVSLTLSDNIDFDGAGGANVTDVGDTFTDDEDTSWDESAASDEITAEINFLTSAPAAEADAGSDAVKVNAGSFKGYVAIYAKGHEGKRLSAKVGKDWVVVPVLASNFERVVEYTGAGYTIAVRIYIDRVLVDTITVTTK